MEDTITWTTAQTKNSAAFISFREELLVKQHPTGRVILVMDDASYHKSASALVALSLFEHRVMVIWLPPYCSDLNPIECLCRFLKDNACANMLQDNIDEVVKSAEKIEAGRNPAKPASILGIEPVSLFVRRFLPQLYSIINGWPDSMRRPGIPAPTD